MEENKETQEVKEEVVAAEVKSEVVEESAAELKERLENAKAENHRKAQELQKLREELDLKKSQPVEQVFNPQDLNTWKDHELKAVQKDPQYAALHDQAAELLERRRFNRIMAEREEANLRMNTELERQKNFPETFDPTHPMAIKASQIMNSLHLERTPAGRLIAARLAASEIQQEKARAAGRKQEQDRQTDVNASFSGGSRPAPKASDKVKLEELKKRAMSGDKAAQAEWFKQRGII